MGNTVLVVSGFFKQGAKETAADKMAKVLEAEAATQKSSYTVWGHGKAVMPGSMTAFSVLDFWFFTKDDGQYYANNNPN